MRNERFRMLLPVERLASLECCVIGVGAIGRQVALQLGTMGVGKIQLVDFDRVEEVNLGSQGYCESDIGQNKVDATASLLHRLNSTTQVEPIAERYARHLHLAQVIFCCVDSITTRRHIWSSVQDEVECFVDGRMAAEVLRIVTAADIPSRSAYPTTLFREQEALQEACTARSTVYCANVAAGLMISQMTQWLRGFPVTFDITLNLLAVELDIKDPASSHNAVPA